jgi:thioredoxin 1
MSFDTPIHTNEHSIDRVMRAGLPVLLVFWRKECDPCVQLEPVLSRLARQYAGKVLLAKVDADDNETLARRYSVERLPRLIFHADGREVAHTTGAASEAALGAWLDRLLSGDRSPRAPEGPSVPLRPDTIGSARTAPDPSPTSRPTPPSPGGPAPSGAAPVVLTDTTFTRTIADPSQPVLVDFWAPWCGPCRMIAPTIEQLAREFSGRATIAKLNVDENPRVASQYGIQSIPAIFVFRNGKVVERLIGVQPATALRQALQKHL